MHAHEARVSGARKELPAMSPGFERGQHTSATLPTLGTISEPKLSASLNFAAKGFAPGRR